MNDTISIKKVNINNHDHPAVKFNENEDISMSFILESVFALIVMAIKPLAKEQKEAFIEAVKHNMSNLDFIKLSNETQDSN